MVIPEIKDCVKGFVNFKFFKNNELWYECGNKFLFPVPVNDTGDGTFFVTDRAMLFMRYIRKHIELLKKEM